MWMQPPPPVTNRWVLHIAAAPHQVDDVLADLCIHQRAKPIGDPEFPAYLVGRYSSYEPPAWMGFARPELERRGYRTRWCGPDCAHHPWPPSTTPPTPAVDGQRSLAARRTSRGRRIALHRLTSGAPHHRTPAPAPDRVKMTS